MSIIEAISNLQAQRENFKIPLAATEEINKIIKKLDSKKPNRHMKIRRT